MSISLGVLMRPGIGRDGLCRVLEGLGYMPGPVEQTVEAFRGGETPRAALVHVELYTGRGLKELSELSRDTPRVPTLGLGHGQNRRLVEQCRRAGAWGYVPWSAKLSDVASALDNILHGGTAFPSSDATSSDEDGPSMHPPSARELEVLRYIGMGADNLKIAALLGISERTVKSHVHSLYRKLNAENRVELALEAERLGVTHSSGPRTLWEVPATKPAG